MINQNFRLYRSNNSFFGPLGYLIDTIKVKVQPNKITWFIWALAPSIAFVSEFIQGVDIHQSLWYLFLVFDP